MSKVSRRGFVAVAAAGAVVLTAPNALAASDSDSTTGSPATTPPAVPSTTKPPAVSLSASGQQGTAKASVSVSRLSDVLAIRYTITNIGHAADSYTVSYTDGATGRNSRDTLVSLDAQQTQNAVLYGSLDHSFTLNVGLSDGTQFTLGPVGKLSVASLSQRDSPAPVGTGSQTPIAPVSPLNQGPTTISVGPASTKTSTSKTSTGSATSGTSAPGAGSSTSKSSSSNSSSSSGSGSSDWTSPNEGWFVPTKV